MALQHPTGTAACRSSMSSKFIQFKFLLLILPLFTLQACEKDPGEGGNSVIKGTVIERSYTTFPSRYTEAGAKDVDVYIIYGDNGNAFDDRTRTSFDGSYKFETLKKGDYRVFVYTEDTALTNFGNTIEIIQQVEITKNRSEVSAPVMTTIRL
jgi:hypothetical protein